MLPPMLSLLLGCSAEHTPGSQKLEAVVVNQAQIDATVERLRLKGSEKVWAQLPWYGNYETARELSQNRQHPIFFFSMFGELDGRC